MSTYNDPRRTRQGWTRMGRFNLPVLPLPVILTDRDDGTLYLVSWNDTSGPDAVGRITLTTDLTAKQRDGYIIWPAFEGPVIQGTSNGRYHLMVRSGHLGIDFVAVQQGTSAHNSPPQYARKKGSLHRRQFTLRFSNGGPNMGWTVDQDTE